MRCISKKPTDIRYRHDDKLTDNLKAFQFWVDSAILQFFDEGKMITLLAPSTKELPQYLFSFHPNVAIGNGEIISMSRLFANTFSSCAEFMSNSKDYSNWLIDTNL